MIISLKLIDSVVVETEEHTRYTFIRVKPEASSIGNLPRDDFEINLLANQFHGECIDISKPYVSHSHARISRPGELEAWDGVFAFLGRTQAVPYHLLAPVRAVPYKKIDHKELNLLTSAKEPGRMTNEMLNKLTDNTIMRRLSY